MNKYNVNVLTDAKEEYTRQLVNILYPEIYIGIKSIYDAAYKHCSRTHTSNQILKKFQTFLAEIPKWNQDKIEEEYKRISIKSECDWIDDLITAVFVSHTKVLSSLKLKNSNKTIPLNVPVGTYFIHKCYVETARNFWKKSWLMHIDVNPIDIQRNLVDSENLIKESIIETIRKLLPVKYILQEYLGEDYQDDDIDENLESHMLSSTKNNLRKLVKQEIEQTLSKKSIDTSDNFSMFEINNSPEEEINEKDKLKNIKENKQLQQISEIKTDIDKELNFIPKESSDDKPISNINKSDSNLIDMPTEKNDEKLIAHTKEETVDKTSHTKEETVDKTSHTKEETVDKTSHTKEETVDKTSDTKEETVDKTSDTKEETVDKTSHTKEETVDKTSHTKEETVDKTSHTKEDTVDIIDKTSDARSNNKTLDVVKEGSDTKQETLPTRKNKEQTQDTNHDNSDLNVKESSNSLDNQDNKSEEKIIEINKDNDKQTDNEKVVKIEKIVNLNEEKDQPIKEKDEPIKLKVDKDISVSKNKDNLEIYGDINDSNDYEPYNLDKTDNPDIHSQGNFSFFDDAIDYS